MHGGDYLGERALLPPRSARSARSAAAEKCEPGSFFHVGGAARGGAGRRGTARDRALWAGGGSQFVCTPRPKKKKELKLLGLGDQATGINSTSLM